MPTKNSNEPKEEYVYRIIPLKYFLQMLDEKCLYFPRVSRWEDPYELFFFKQKFVTKDGAIIDFIKDSQRIYGECWTKQRDSDALWRIYSPDRYSVRIKTTINQINEIINNQNPDISIKGDFVRYRNPKQLASWIQEQKSSLSEIKNALKESLFIKRNSFSHEKEYRIIISKSNQIQNDTNIPNEDFIKLSFDPSKFIKEVSLDPRLSENEVILLKHAISMRMGQSRMVSQSTLYKFEQKQIIIE